MIQLKNLVKIRTVEEVTKKIESIINGTSKGDTVDWLTEVTRKNDLRKFFPD